MAINYSSTDYIITGIPSTEDYIRICINGAPSNTEISKKGEFRKADSHKPLIMRPRKRCDEIWIDINVGKRLIVIKMNRAIGCLFIPIPEQFLEEGYTQTELEVKCDKDIEEQMSEDFELNIDDYYWVPLQKPRNKQQIPLSEQLIIKACEMKDQGSSEIEILQETGISITQQQKIYFGQTRYDISKEYKFMDPKSYLEEDVIHEIEKLVRKRISTADIRDAVCRIGYHVDLKDIRLCQKQMILSSEDQSQVSSIMEIIEQTDELIVGEEFRRISKRIANITGIAMGVGSSILNSFLSDIELTKSYSFQSIHISVATFYIKLKDGETPYKMSKSIQYEEQLKHIVLTLDNARNIFYKLFKKKIPECVGSGIEISFLNYWIRKEKRFQDIIVKQRRNGRLECFKHSRTRKESRT